MASKKRMRKTQGGASPPPAAAPQEAEDVEDSAPSGEVSLDLSLEGFERLWKPILVAAVLGLFVSCAKLSSWQFFTDGAPVMLFVLAGWAAYVLQNQQKSPQKVWGYGVPLMLAVMALFAYYSNNYGFPLDSDYSYFSVMVGIFCLFYALSYQGLVKVETSAVAALFLATLLIHLVPAQAPLLSNLDSYWSYKWMQRIYTDGELPQFDPLVYPLYGGIAHHNDPAVVAGMKTTFGLYQTNTAMLTPLTYSTIALALGGLGISLFDVAMLFPGIHAALTIVVMYLLVKEMFTEMKPYNKMAAFAAAFMFMLSPALAMQSTASNPEDDSFGMFLMISALYLFFASYHRRSFKYSALCGVAFLLLRLGWGGATYAFLTIGAFGTLLAIVNFLHNRNALEHLPYILVPAAFYHLISLFAHAKGGAPVYHPMAPNELYPLLTAIGMSIILEYVRYRRNGAQLAPADTVEGRTVNLLERNIAVLGVVAIVLAAASLVFYKTPQDWMNFVYQGLMSAKEKSVVHQTVAEQNPMATSVWEFLNDGYNRYGIALLYGLVMMPVLAYLIYSNATVGALFLLTWSMPMMWGAYNKSAWIFASSPSITALGATVGLFAAAKKEDLDGLRVIGTILLISIPLFYIPTLGPTMYNRFVGYIVMHMGPTSDIYYWNPALEWHANNTRPGDAILTWWDYGHWFTSVSKRPVLIDNLQADYYEIQDVARFFMNETSEDEAFEIVKTYNRAYKDYNPDWGLNYATIDWTMIGKGSALHYIATGVIENVTPGSWKNYAQCEFLPDQSQIDEKLVVGENGTFSKVRQLVFGCQGYVAGVIFEIEGDEVKNIVAVNQYGSRVPWATWAKANDASLLGVQPLVRMNEREKMPSILWCAINSKSLPRGHICNMPQFTTLVYVPQEFNDFMMTRLYLGKYLDEYKALGLYNREVKPLEHFREIPDYDNDGTPDGEFAYGFVRSYEIGYEGFANRTQDAAPLNPEGLLGTL
jgi:asparagine N-glycosylation enzyme membrane subunit Stt3